MADQVVLVTGAGSGLGAAIAARSAADGAHVVVNDLDGDAATQVAKAVGGQPVVFDVADPAAVTAAVDDLAARYGRIDGLVNNAGIAPHRPEVTARSISNLTTGAFVATEACSSLSDEEWDRMIRVHVYGTFHCTRAVLRYMEQATPVDLGDGRGQRRGAIVNIASIAGLNGLPTAPDYSAAKGAVVAFTKSVAAEVAPLGIRVNAVAPAFIDTPLLEWMDPMMKELLAARSGAGRFGRPDEVADAVAYLLGDESTYCFGEILTLTGGFR